MLKLVLPTKYLSNIKHPKERGMGYPIVPTHCTFRRQDSKRIAKPYPSMIKPYWEDRLTTIVKIKEPGMCLKSEEKCTKQGHFVVIIIVALGMIWFGKVSVSKGFVPVTRSENPSNNTFAKHNKIEIMFISCMGNCNGLRINEYELIKVLSFDEIVTEVMKIAKAFLYYRSK